jgi:hypothetical protein
MVQRNVRKQIHATLGVRIFCGTRTRQRIHKTVGQPWDLTRMGTATDELKLDIAIKPLVLML